MKKILIIGAAVAAVGLGAVLSAWANDEPIFDTETSASDSDESFSENWDYDRPEPDDDPPPLELSAADAVAFTEATNPGYIRSFCQSYVAIGDYDLALMAYKAEIGEGGGTQDGVKMPTFDETFDETLSRC